MAMDLMLLIVEFYFGYFLLIIMIILIILNFLTMLAIFLIFIIIMVINFYIDKDIGIIQIFIIFYNYF